MPHQRLKPAFTFTDERLAELREVVPEAFADGGIDWTVLRESLSGWVDSEDEGAEHFALTWPGKRDARRLASVPSKGALVPVAGDGVNDDKTRNQFVVGDNLEVLKLLQKSYAGRVKMIYIDPPYNTGNDFVYDDDFKEPIETYLRRTGQLDEAGEPLTTNTRADGRFHSKWLSMMYPRLRLARSLLAESGALFVSLDDGEVAHARVVLNEIFGDENFIGQLVWQRSKKGDAKLIATVHEYILVYARNKSKIVELGGWRRRKQGVDEVLAEYASLRQRFGSNHAKIRVEMREWYKALAEDDPRRAHEHYNWSDDRGLYFAADFAGPDDGRKSRPRYDILHPVTHKSCAKPSTGWRWDEKRTVAALAETPPRIHFGVDETTIPCRKSYLFEVDSEAYGSVFYRDGRAATLEVEQLVGKGVFPFPKSVDVLVELIELASSGGDLLVDFFAGSGSFGQAAFEANRKDGGTRNFICVQLDEPIASESAAAEAGFTTIAEIGKERLRRAIKRMVKEQKPAANEDLGFRVLKLTRSHFRAWKDYVGDNVNRLADLFDQADDPLADGWTPEGLMTEVTLMEGFPLDSRVERVAAAKKNEVTRVSSANCAHSLFACFDEKVYAESIKGLELAETDAFVCLDRALTDESKLRLSDRCLLKTI